MINLYTANNKMILFSTLKKHILIVLLFSSSIFTCIASADNITFDDSPLDQALVLPSWFTLSFLEIANDIEDVKAQNKKGLIIYFEHKFCPYCKAHLENNWGQDDIVKYTQKNFDVIAINVKGQRPVLDIDGKTYTEKTFSAFKKTNFTPSILFYNTNKQEVLRLRGYRPPYQFRAALEYVADEHYKKETFKDYIARAEFALSYGKKELNKNSAFNSPPYLLDRSLVKADQPLMVVFERKRCHACDVLHGGPLVRPEIEIQLLKLDAVQFDMETSQPLITPDGQKLTAQQWAEKLNINYSPTILFFDESGKEIIRIESVVWFYRLRNVLKYVLSGDYKKYSTFQLWRQAKNIR